MDTSAIFGAQYDAGGVISKSLIDTGFRLKIIIDEKFADKASDSMDGLVYVVDFRDFGLMKKTLSDLENVFIILPSNIKDRNFIQSHLALLNSFLAILPELQLKYIVYLPGVLSSESLSEEERISFIKKEREFRVRVESLRAAQLVWMNSENSCLY
ncbi:hypothetical protein [Mucilaginibacter sp. SG564]|uniref:hypothetical protein n=1 Tax=Mucilaginibacter sp. SG564 TaxID=2587022 RepID=UPI001555257B|nr:hypothetical protein [Mucilaginibacter sp. SG564]NOW96035.1 hypothetical protein [Mucilaginibacter sp. SG564]